MKRKTSIIIIIILVIMLIAIGIFMFGEINKGNSSKPTSTNTLNDKKNEIANQIANEITENVLKNEIENNTTIENTIENTTTPTETFEETPKTAEEKAISIVKKDWGEDKNVDIAIDGMDNNGNYIVAVRDSSTTEAKAFYTVNTSSGTFTKREMN